MAQAEIERDALGIDWEKVSFETRSSSKVHYSTVWLGKNSNGIYNKLWISKNLIELLGWDGKDINVEIWKVEGMYRITSVKYKTGAIIRPQRTGASLLTNLNLVTAIHARTKMEEFDAWVADGALIFKYPVKM